MDAESHKKALDKYCAASKHQHLSFHNLWRKHAAEPNKPDVEECVNHLVEQQIAPKLSAIEKWHKAEQQLQQQEHPGERKKKVKVKLGEEKKEALELLKMLLLPKQDMLVTQMRAILRSGSICCSGSHFIIHFPNPSYFIVRLRIRCNGGINVAVEVIGVTETLEI
jgi:hypothetical protein